MVQDRRYQSLLGTYSVFTLRPVGRCEGLIQLKKAHCNSAWSLPPTQPFVLICTPIRSVSPELGIHGNFVDESFMRVVQLTLPTHAAELAQGTGGVHLWYGVERSVQIIDGACCRTQITCRGVRHFEADPKPFVPPCSCCTENICTMRTTIQNDI